MVQRLKRLPPMPETRVQSMGREDPLEKEMVTHSSILTWRIPWILSSSIINLRKLRGLPWWLSGKKSTCQCRRQGFDLWFGKIPHAAEQLNPCATTAEPVLHGPGAPNPEARMPQSLCSATRQATTVRDPGTTATEQPPLTAAREEPVQRQGLSTAKNKSH